MGVGDVVITFITEDEVGQVSTLLFILYTNI